MTKRTLTMLGTGYATATRCYNTCFTIKSDGTTLLVDAGGVNTILNRLEESGTPMEDIHYMYLTHAHTDHVLGAVWVVRMVMQMSRNGIYDGVLHVYGHDKVLGVLEWICRQTLPAKFSALIGSVVMLHEVEDGDSFSVDDMTDDTRLPRRRTLQRSDKAIRRERAMAAFGSILPVCRPREVQTLRKAPQHRTRRSTPRRLAQRAQPRALPHRGPLARHTQTDIQG